jgi:DnaK suppressor protein
MNRKRNNPVSNKLLMETFKTKLESCRVELLEATHQVTKQGREIVDDSALDVADRAVNTSTKEFLFLQAQERHRLLQKVEAALARIRGGSFGKCLACGAEIGTKRLEAVPWTEYCVRCQERRERGESVEGDYQHPETHELTLADRVSTGESQLSALNKETREVPHVA